MKLLKLGILASGPGSNFQAIWNSIQAGRLHAQVQVVISNNADAGALDFACTHGLPAVHLARNQYDSKESFVQAFLKMLNDYKVNFIVLAGYMKLLSPEIVSTFRNRIINIHPALLPSFGGKGMYGHFVHEAVLAQGCKMSGVTVHLVNEEYDQGPIVAQQCVPVLEQDTPESLAERVLKVEHVIFSQALQLFAEERVEVVGRRAVIK
jgi:phosphoribosylglycinamide formyltransferase-1